MWAIVMFDLPVITKMQQHNATAFRNELLSQGFIMMQYSVYTRPCRDITIVDAIERHFLPKIPIGGKVNVIAITDKQYERIASFYGKTLLEQTKNAEQLTIY